MKTIEEYLSLPYTRILRRDTDGDVVAHIEELPGCVAHGETDQEALANIDEMQRAWIEEALEANQPVPEPLPVEAKASGRWLQRVPRSLHAKLTTIARREGASLNQLVTTFLAEAVGMRSRPSKAPRVRTGWSWTETREGKRSGAYVVQHHPAGAPSASMYLNEFRRKIPETVGVGETDFEKEKYAH